MRESDGWARSEKAIRAWFVKFVTCKRGTSRHRAPAGPSDSRLVWGLLKEAGLTEQKDDLCFSFSDGRTEHLTELTYTESKGLLDYLNKVLGREADPVDKMCRKILSMAHEMHWRLPGTKRIDMQRVNNWCVRYSGHNKPLDAFTYLELPALVTQFTRVYNDFLKGI